MRGPRVLLALAALFVFSVSGQSARAQATVSYYGFEFPLRIGLLTRGEITDFEKTSAGLGYGIRYSGESLRVDIFVYNLRKRSINWDVFHADQKQEFENAVRDVQRAKERGLYRDVMEGKEFESPAVKNPFFWCKAFVIDRGEGRVEDSALCLGAQNNTFVKVRLSMTPAGSNIPEKADKLMREIARGIKF